MSLSQLIRCHRTLLLSESDWTQLNDSDLTSESKQHWMTYRQALRDLPVAQTITEITDFSQVVWPTKPE